MMDPRKKKKKKKTRKKKKKAGRSSPRARGAIPIFWQDARPFFNQDSKIVKYN
jgi:hypothetical protein